MSLPKLDEDRHGMASDVSHLNDYGLDSDPLDGQTEFPLGREYYHETNPILGDYPSVKEVDTYMPLAMLAHTVVAMAIPDTTLRRIWQCVWIGLESASVYKNYSLGVRLEF
jgi:hypothetical protein